MPLEALTSRQAVLDAIAEFDEIGRDEFLARYGFGPARDVMLVLDGRRYDSKAIVAAAHGHQHPELGPLRPADFSGGRPTIAKLSQLGFEIERLSSPDDEAVGAGPVLAEFLELYSGARGEQFGGSHPAVDALKRAAEALRQQLPPSLTDERVRPSVGQGNWAAVPWIAVLDAREAITTQHGIYPVLLIPEGLSGVYLTIAQGVTDLKRDRGRLAAYAALAERAQALRPSLGQLASAGFGYGEDVNLGGSNLGRDYAASVVISKFFDRDALETSDLDDDFIALCAAYGELLEGGALVADSTKVHEPAVMSVYVGRDAEQNFATGGRRGWWGWRQPHRELFDVKAGDLILFGFGYSGGSPRVPADTWTQHRVARVVVGRIEQVPFRTDEAIMPDEAAGNASYPYKVRFELIREFADVQLDERGGLSPSVAEAIRLSAVRQGTGIVRPVEGSALLEPLVEQERVIEPTVPLDEIAEAFVEAVGASGLRLDERLVGTFVVAALTKPFLILTGLSGSGKTQLAKRLGEWCGTDAAGRPRYAVIPVRPDWTGPEYLFGFPDGLQARVNGQTVWAVPETLEFLLHANAEPAQPFVLVLDEMNLAHVERYFADFLSGLESREPVLPDLRHENGKWLERDSSRRLPLPRNVTVVGTVNIDETTYLFSPKVLDRAFTFEFRVSDSDLDPAARRPAPSASASDATLQSLVAYQQDDDWQFEHPHPGREALAEDLRELHRILSPGGLEFGHRVMYESLRFAALLGEALSLDRDDVLDAIALTKVLPKVHGARQRLEPVLRDLITFADGERESGEPRLPATGAKSRRMLDVLLEAQFVSFTE
jgi:5-methylcytosine-specific restriction protein B